MKKRIGWLRGRPIIENIGVKNNLYKEVILNSEEANKENIIKNLTEEDFGPGEYTGEFYGITWTSKVKHYIPTAEKSIKYYINAKINNQNNIQSTYANTVNYIFSKAIPDLKEAEKLISGITNYINLYQTIAINTPMGISTLKGTCRSNANSWSGVFEREPLEEVDVVLPKIKVLFRTFSNTTKLKKFKLSAPQCISARGLITADVQEETLEEVDIDLPNLTDMFSISRDRDNIWGTTIKKLKLNLPKCTATNILYSGSSLILNDGGVSSGDKVGSCLTEVEIVGGGFPETTLMQSAFLGHWYLPKLVCRTPKAENITGAFLMLNCCRDLILDLSMASLGLEYAISTNNSFGDNSFKSFFEAKREHILKYTKYKSWEEMDADKWMHSFEIGPFGQADTFDGPLNLSRVYLHRNLTVDIFNKLYDRKANGKTVECKIVFNSASFDELTQEDIKIATDKGFTILKN